MRSPGRPVLGRGMKASISSTVQSILMFGCNLLMVGWRFHPTDEELITKHLKPKSLGKYEGEDEVIGELDVCKFEPWDLPKLSKLDSDDDKVWYFLCPRNFYRNSRRTKRRTRAGFWKPTGKNLAIKAKRTKTEIGTKKTLVFYEKATPKDLRTGWIIHEYEYTPEPNISVQEEFVLIKLKNKDGEKGDGSDQSHHMASVLEDRTSADVENQDPSFQQNFHQDTYGGGEPSHEISSNNQDQSLKELAVTSASNQIQVGHYLASDSGYASPNELVARSTNGSCLPASDFGNQKSTFEFGGKWMPFEDTPADVRSQSPYPYDNSDLSCLTASLPQSQNNITDISASGKGKCGTSMALPTDFGKQNPLMSYDLPTPYDSSLAYPSQFEYGGERIPSVDTPPDIRNQSPYDKSDHSISQTQNSTSDISASGKGQCGTSLALSSDFGNLNPLMSSDIPTLLDTPLTYPSESPLAYPSTTSLTYPSQIPLAYPSESSLTYPSQIPLAYPSESSLTYPSETMVPQGAAMSPELTAQSLPELTGDDMDISSYVENQSPYDNSDFSCLRASDLEDQSPCNHSQSGSLVATDAVNQNNEKNSSISASQSLAAPPFHFEDQNPPMSDFSVPGENYWSSLMALLSENNVENEMSQQGIILPEEQSQLLAEYDAFFELQKSLNSNAGMQATCAEEMPVKNGIDASVCT